MITFAELQIVTPQRLLTGSPRRAPARALLGPQPEKNVHQLLAFGKKEESLVLFQYLTHLFN